MLQRRIPLMIAALAVAVLPSAVRAQDPPPPPEVEKQPETIVQVLEKQGNYTTFLSAIRTAGLEETLRTRQSLTVFAPTDQAFEKLSQEKRAELWADQAGLKALVESHIATREIQAEQVTEPVTVETLQGSSVEVTREGETLQVHAPAPGPVTRGEDPPARITATATTTNIAASNGVIHAVDTVLFIEG